MHISNHAARISSFIALAGLAAGAAHAHVGLQAAQASVGAGYKAVLTVPHGCKGSATVRLSVQIPDGVIAVKPQIKPGWTIETTQGKYARPYTFHGNQVSEGVRTITWSGGSLPDAYYDEFAFSSQIASTLTPGSTLAFPTVQTCEHGVERWIELPSAGQKHPEKPAPVITLLPARKP
ncbi:MAG: hypothetical protein BGO13_06880 [Burkholderiales bacterium 66-5]|uniref:YcnI family copper-binding membrane protein n=1 Tax=Comamonas badia TaxID=265291 RepID=UPI0003F58BA4|nr:YcnI family protein [Comamonas badia]OJU91553.1 MAG: hypothetical protein BGO13_06880 [Burkholderiales bacterium 66-5]